MFDFWLFIKGMLMGAADIVPGVSGGTIAFITGIYEKLIGSVQSILPSFFRFCSHRKLSTFWADINGLFLVTLLLGILTSVALFSNLISYLLSEYPIPLWSFFFGLIVVSAFWVGKGVNFRSFKALVSLLIGVMVALLISRSAPAQLEASAFNAFISGAIAICAMILPGISGSFILVLLGSYSFVLTAIQSLDVALLGAFVGGCAVGLLSIANLLVWAFGHYRQIVLALLTGFMVGALDKVWPWKEVVSYRVNRHGEQVPLLENNVSPFDYLSLTEQSPELALSITSAILAVVLVLVIERVALSATMRKDSH
jgi:putative membrane protein